MNRLFIAAWLCLATTASAQEQAPDFSGSYLCKTTAIGGIARGDGDAWQATKFGFGDESYIVKVKHTGKTMDVIGGVRKIYNIEVKRYGTQDEFKGCYTRSTDIEVPDSEYFGGGFECHSFPSTHQYKFDLHNGRFQIIAFGDYLDRLPRSKPRPATITIGTCDKID